jgi:hypothetical protein
MALDAGASALVPRAPEFGGTEMARFVSPVDRPALKGGDKNRRHSNETYREQAVEARAISAVQPSRFHN